MRNRVILLFAILCSFMVEAAVAQSFRVRGKVTSIEDGEGMINLTIMQKGTGNGVVTDFDGNYEIEVQGAADATLVFTYVGYSAQEHSVNAGTGVLNVVMEPEQIAMDEVVVVAYGVRKKGTVLICKSLMLRLRKLPVRLINGRLFSLMICRSIIPKVYLCGKTGMIRLAHTKARQFLIEQRRWLLQRLFLTERKKHRINCGMCRALCFTIRRIKYGLFISTNQLTRQVRH